MDNRTKRKKPPDRGRVKTKPPDGLKAMPKEIALGALQEGTQRIASRLRDAGQRDERSDYGGERIEAAAADGTRLAARSVEAFLKSGAAALSRNKGEEAPQDDLPSDAPSQETVSETEAAPVQNELTSAERPALPECAESPALPEHPAPETAAGLPSTDKTALPEHPAVPEAPAQTETPIAEEQSAEPEDKPSKRRSRRDEESASTERTEEESWRPTYKDAEPDALRRPATVIVRKPGGAAEAPGERDFPRARQSNRTVKTLGGRDAPPLLQGQGAREPAALPTAGQSPAVEYGRRKLIQERGRELAAKRTEIPLLEGNSGAEPLPLPEHGAEYHEPQIWEPPVMRTGETNAILNDALPERINVGDSRGTVRTKETPPLAELPNADRELVKERELSPSAPRSGSVSADGSGSGVTPKGADAETPSAPKAPQTGRVGVKTREASGYPTASTGADTAKKTAVQGKQKAVRERAEQVAEQRISPSIRQESVSVSPETSAPPSEQSAVPVKTKATYARNETPSAEPESQSAAQGKNKLVRERMEQAAERRVDTRIRKPNPAASADTPAPISERNVTVKTKEMGIPQDATPPNGVTPGQRKAVKERTEQVAGRRVDTGIGERNPAASADTPTPISERSVAVKTKATDVPRDAVPPSGVTQGQRKAVRERVEQVAKRRIDTVAAERNPAASADTPALISERNVTVKTKEASIPQEPTLPSGVTPGQRKAIRERAQQVAEQHSDTVAAERNPAASVKLSASTPEQSPVPVKTKAALQQEAPQEAPRVKERAILERPDDVPAQRGTAPTREQSSVKTKEAYPGQDTPSAEPRSVAAGRQKALQDSAGRIAERRTESGVREESAALTDAPNQNAAPVKTKEAYAQRETPPADSSRPEVSETPRTPVKTREAHIQSGGTTAMETVRTERMPVKTKEAYAQTGSASKFTEPESAALRRDASPRINGEKPSVKTKTTTAPHVAETPPPFDKTQPLRQQATVTVKTKDADIPRPRSVSPDNATRETGGKVAVKTREALTQSAEQAPQAPDIPDATGNAYGRRDVPLSKERTNYAINSEQRPPSGEQSRAADSKPTLKKTHSDNDAVRKAAGEQNPSVTPSDEGVKTKDAWLRQQGKDRPKEQDITGVHKSKPRMKGELPVKLAKGLPAPKGTDSFPPALPPWEPSAPTGGGTETPPTRFVREKGATAAGNVVRDLVPSAEKGLRVLRPTPVKEAGKTGAKAVRTAERSARTVKTAEAMSLRMARNAARSVRMGRDAAVAAKRSAKTAASTIREAPGAVVSTVKSAVAAAQSLVSALAAGGTTAIVIVVVVCLVAALIAAPFGLFLSGQTGVGENIQTAVSELTGEYNARIEQIKAETTYDELDVAEDIVSVMQNNWKNVLAVYAVRVTTKGADATEVVTLTDEKKEILRETFWDMNRISYRTTSRTVYSGDDDDEGTVIVTLHISVTTKTAEEMADEYHFNAGQRGLLEEMLSPEYDELFESLLAGVEPGGGSPVLDPEILDGITLLMPGDLSEQRRQVVLTGAQLLGRVHYFWGGKSRVLGWDSRWGTPARVWAAGSPSTGTVRPFGLDCSGFVDWVFYNVSGGTYLIGHGGGASAQHSYCTPISWSEALPGDLVFYPGDRHVGIVVGHDTFGNVKIMHCASGSNNVVITGKIGFVSIGRPRYYAS